MVLGFSVASAGECICFELKGEFGEEIKAILHKYTKNMGDKNITIIPENDKKSQSFAESLVGIVDGGGSKAEGYDAAMAQKFYYNGCSSCHGDKGEATGYGGKAIRDMSKEDILDAIYSYQDGSYKGASRFSKSTATAPLRKIDSINLAEYISKLKETKK